MKLESTMLEIAAQAGAFLEFAAVAERVNAANTRAEKATVLRQYLFQLRDDHLLHAIHYFTGHAFSRRDRSSVPIGEVTLISALSIVTGVEPALLAMQRFDYGDLATVGARLLIRQTESVLTLDDVAIAIEQLSKAKGKRRLNWVVKLLDRATPLEVKYLINLLQGDLQIDLEEEILEVAVAQISGQPTQRIQWVHMLSGDLGKTAVLARHDQLDQAHMQVFQPIKFMLASTASDATRLLRSLAQGYAIETKYDGMRAQAHIAPADRASDDPFNETVVAGIRVALFSRTLEEITANFPDLLMPLAALAPRALVSGESAGLILDGEIVPYRDGKILPFTLLQQRLGNSSKTEDLVAMVPVAFIVYDILYKDGTVLINQPYGQRRALLEALPIESSLVQLASAHQFFDLEALGQQFRQARAEGQEGFMVKMLQSLYRPGRRSKDWFKVKHPIATLDVVVTAAEIDPLTHPSLFSLFAIAVRASESDASLLNIGKVSASLSLPNFETLSDWVQQHTIEEFANGQVHLVEPQIVLEVIFDAIQASSHHKGGYKLEGVRILRVRRDKPAQEIDTIETIRELAELQREEGWDSRT